MMWKLQNIKSCLRNTRKIADRLGGWISGRSAGPAFCFYCGVDSKPLIVLFLATLGMMILGAVFIFLWTVAAGHWSSSEEPKYKILEAESNGSQPKN